MPGNRRRARLMADWTMGCCSGATRPSSASSATRPAWRSATQEQPRAADPVSRPEPGAAVEAGGEERVGAVPALAS